MIENKLWIFGDSFSVIDMNDRPEKNWTFILAKKLNYQLHNYSIAGISQDYTFRCVQHFRNEITENDQIIILLTERARFFFSEDHVHITNAWLTDLPKYLPQNIGQAAAAFFKHIQRPTLDHQWETQRLGWLNNLVRIKKFKKPLVLFGFDRDVQNLESDYDNLIFSDDYLFNVSEKEFVKRDSRMELFDVSEPRNCHLCYSNHMVLAEKIFLHLDSNKSFSLKNDFFEAIINEESLTNKKFIEDEFSSVAFKTFMENTKNKKKYANINIR